MENQNWGAKEYSEKHTKIEAGILKSTQKISFETYINLIQKITWYITEKRMFVLSWYTALAANIGSSSFSTEQLSPTMGIDSRELRLLYIAIMIKKQEYISRRDPLLKMTKSEEH